LNSGGLLFEVIDVLTGTSIKRRGAISGRPLPERTLDPQSAARQTHLCPSQPRQGISQVGLSHGDGLMVEEENLSPILSIGFET